jgi:hypothetical protein
MRTEAWKSVEQEYEIQQKYFYEYTKQKSKSLYANNDIVAELSFAGEKIPLSKFDINSNPQQNIKKAVSTRIKKGSQRIHFKHAFYAKIYGNLGIFERMGTKRLPIREIPALAGAQMVENEDVLDNMFEVAEKTIDKRIDHEITRILNGWGTDWRTK